MLTSYTQIYLHHQPYTQKEKRENAVAIAAANKAAEKKEKDAAKKTRKEKAKAEAQQRKQDEERFAESTKRRMEEEARALDQRRTDREARRERELEKMRVRSKAMQESPS